MKTSQGTDLIALRRQAHVQCVKGEQIYKSRLRRLLEPDQRGKYVAIDTISGDYFLADELLDAYDKGAAKYPGRTFYYKRVGFVATSFIGAY